MLLCKGPGSEPSSECTWFSTASDHPKRHLPASISRFPYNLASFHVCGHNNPIGGQCAPYKNNKKKIPVGARYFVHVQTDLGAHPASYKMGTAFSGVKRPDCGVDLPHPSGAEVKKRVGPYRYSSSGPSWPVQS